jgi:Ni/Fe-hydrogenase subunit HybB-like protein
MSAASESGLARQATWIAGGAAALGIAAFATGLGHGEAPRTFAVLLANWLFFMGLSMGGVAFRALFQIFNARWTLPLTTLGGKQASFVPVGAVLLLVIIAGSGVAPWMPDPSGWLGLPALLTRQVALNGVLFVLAWVCFRPSPAAARAPSPAIAVFWFIAYCLVLSFWAFDFVLGADRVFEDTLIGPFVFSGAFISGLCVSTLLGIARRTIGEEQRRDAAKLVLAFAIFWAYLAASQYLTIWYGNLPEEIGYALRRSVDGWGALVLAAIGLVFIAPFFVLLYSPNRKSARLFSAALVSQLLGVWLTCQILVVPSVTAPGTTPITLRDLLIALGMLGAYALSVLPSLREPRTAGPAGATVPQHA